MRTLRNVLIALAAAAALGGGFLAFELHHPSIKPFQGMLLTESAPPSGGLRAVFLGTATVLLDDGETSILTDGFVTRPDLRHVAMSRIEPDKILVADALTRIRANHLAAVFAVHSHYDHALDAPEVARQTGALLVGSPSTANIGRGSGLPESQIRVAKDGEVMSFGKFQVTMLRSLHSPHALYSGEVTAPLPMPARASDYKEGGTYSVLVTHGGRTILIQGSANFVPGALAGRHIDVAFFGIPTLGKQPHDFQEAYWKEVVLAAGVRRVIPIHWDDFMQPLAQGLVPMPRAMDDFEAGMRFVEIAGKRDGVDVKLAPAWISFDPFAGLAEPAPGTR
jgi:L-ascorbate metabolism protein UlaG (beta-lactamase superfamily)